MIQIYMYRLGILRILYKLDTFNNFEPTVSRSEGEDRSNAKGFWGYESV